jgi:hypothetical protein
MSDFLPLYQKVDPTTWAYLSSLLMIGIFFKFSRFWSVRNLDIVLLILLAPGLILAQKGIAELLKTKRLAESAKVEQMAAAKPATEATSDPVPAAAAPAQPEVTAEQIQNNRDRGFRLVRWGFLWLLGISLVWLVRLLLDPTMVRRPLLEPNLSAGGMLFWCACLLMFLSANVIVGRPETTRLETDGAVMAGKVLQGQDIIPQQQAGRTGPGYWLIHVLPRIATRPFLGEEGQGERADIVTAKVIAILSQLAIVAGMIVIGYWHFDNIRMGIGAATLYMMLPYSAQMTGHVDHALPAALILWAVVFYRYPLYAGMLIGLGMGTSYFALYLLPLWISFYWQRGLARFVIGTVVSLAVLAGVLALTSDGLGSFWQKVQAMFGLYWPMAMTDLDGIWNSDLPGHWAPEYRIPIFAVFVILAGGFAVWPAQKNLGTLLSCSAAVMVATQFWQGFGSGHGGDGGGMFMAWYLPLTLLSVFRPNLEDRVALSVLGEGWFPRRRMLKMHLERAA